MFFIPSKSMNFEKNTSLIFEYMREILYTYSKIRGKKDLGPNQFWDSVIISASDEGQKTGYEKQIEEKQLRNEVPPNIPFHVFADPPGYKIGCGGSTMFVLEKMSHIYGTSFSNMRILLIPAGGYSQRLPNLTSLGKLFCPLPFGDMNYQMLDLILATYLPFLKDMPPGVFLASSDAIISYSLSEKDEWTFNNDGFTAIGHPSPVHVGCGHGVYVLPEIKDLGDSSTFMSECVRVLQKPSIEKMQENRAVMKKSGHADGEEVIFSDSAFFFDHRIVTKLITFYNSNKPLKWELSSYGDFLQPLGTNASPSYIVESETNEDLALQRSALYRTLYGTNLSILILKNSFFHHLGSMKEYLESFCFKNNFSHVFPVCRLNCMSWSVNGLLPLYIEGTVLHSMVHPMSFISEDTVVEYCDISIVVNIGKNCIISNIQLQGLPVQRLMYDIPSDTLLHTVALQGGFVTIACSVNDDIKKVYENRQSFEITFFGKKLKAFLAPGVECFTPNCNQFSLWNAKIFPVKNAAKESVIETLRIISCSNEGEMCHLYHCFDEECIKLVSMKDILLLKNAEKMIDYQQELFHRIKLKNN